MAGDIILELPLKPYLCKFLTYKFGASHRITKTSWLGGIIIGYLDKDFKVGRARTINTKGSYQLVISNEVFSSYGFHISNQKFHLIEKLIDKIFRSTLHDYIETSMASELQFYSPEYGSNNKQNRLRAISQFLAQFNIEEDELSVEALYRDYDRTRKKTVA